MSLIVACGGGSNNSTPETEDTDSQPQEQNDQNQNQEEQTEESEENNDPEQNDDDQNDTNLPLVRPILTATNEGEQVSLNWSNANASEYRILFMQGTDSPIEVTSTDLSYNTSTLDAGSYTILLEAYDSLGNSLFSAPQTVEVQ